jgi:hypothetical protein
VRYYRTSEQTQYLSTITRLPPQCRNQAYNSTNPGLRPQETGGKVKMLSVLFVVLFAFGSSAFAQQEAPIVVAQAGGASPGAGAPAATSGVGTTIAAVVAAIVAAAAAAGTSRGTTGTTTTTTTHP